MTPIIRHRNGRAYRTINKRTTAERIIELKKLLGMYKRP